jgi:hypothetical protein
MMATRTYTAYLCNYAGQLLNRAAFAELLETSQFGYLEINIVYVPVLIQNNLNLAVAFQPGYGIYYYSSFHRLVFFFIN